MTPQELVTGVVRLVSLPEVCIRVNEMLEDPNVNAADIGKVIGQDTGLTARLLKIVNSAFYGFPSRIETVSRAVTVIGLRELRGLVLAASAVEAFSRIPTDLLNMVKFWRHSVYCGVIAQLLAEQVNVLHSERLFVDGLLHDIGKLIICHKIPEQAQEVMRRVESEQRPDFEIENEIMGFDHADVGGELLKVWQMPASLCNAVHFHHRPQQAEESVMDVCLVNIANVMALSAEQEADAETVIQEIDAFVWQTTGLDASVIEPVFTQAGPLFTEALESILPRSYRS